MKSGLAEARRCAWLKGTENQAATPVWVRGKTIAFRCPKSIITAQSLTFLEQFLYWRRCSGNLWELDAKTADALMALQEESEKENHHEEEQQC
jgi:hypothetical protein